MIDVNEAVEMILRHTPLLPAGDLPLLDCLGHVLAREIVADEPMPPFATSAMDGYLVRLGDVERGRLEVAGEIRPGALPMPGYREGSAHRIFTGAPVPEWGEAVVIKEQAREEDGVVTFDHRPVKGEHIREKGREFKAGDRIFAAGTVVTPPVVGTLASLGCVEAPVHRKPRAAVIVTGDELVPYGSSPGPGEIRDANTHSVSAALISMGLDRPLTFHVRDQADEVKTCIEEALAEADVVISVGGVSVGKYDFVKPALEALTVETLFWRVAMKPGKPNYFGKKGGTLVFGLPGNTVSALISFHLLVRPALRKMQGGDPRARNTFRARLDTDLEKKASRLELVRGCAFRDAHREWRVKPVRGRGSHMLGSLAQADCIIYFPREESRLPRGAWVEVELLRWTEF